VKLGIIVPVVVAMGAIACSGASDAGGLFSGTPTPNNAAGGDKNPGDDGDGTPDASAGGNDSGNSGGKKDGGETTPDAAVVDAPPDVPAPVEGVWCGEANGKDVYCKSPEFCCVQSGPTRQCSGGIVDLCGVTNDGIKVECDSPSDCKAPNGICCAERQNGRYTSVTCRSTCSGSSYVRFCHPGANDCLQGQQCRASQLLPGYYACQ
jgi:hypothetical protein